MVGETSQITGLNVACVCGLLGVGSPQVFASPQPINIDELLPDEFFNWHEIGIGCNCALCCKKTK